MMVRGCAVCCSGQVLEQAETGLHLLPRLRWLDVRRGVL